MFIPLIKNWRITTDPFNFLLQHKVVMKTGKRKGQEEWKMIGYYRTLLEAIESASTHKIRGFETESLDELVKEIKALNKNLTKAVQTLKPIKLKN